MVDLPPSAEAASDSQSASMVDGEAVPPVKRARRHKTKGDDQPNWSELLGQQGAIPEAPRGTTKATEDAPPGGMVRDEVQRERVADMAANRQLRDDYAKRAYDLACGCISMWAVMLGAQGIIKVITGLEMWSDKVLIAVTSGVTVSVLAAFLGVIRGLFGTDPGKKPRKPRSNREKR